MNYRINQIKRGEKMNNIQSIINKVSADSKFRKDLLDNPTDALQNAGLTPNPTLLTVLERLVDFKEELTDPNNMWGC